MCTSVDSGIDFSNLGVDVLPLAVKFWAFENRFVHLRVDLEQPRVNKSIFACES